MKYCDDYAALLDLYVDGELSPEEMAGVQAHLDTCPGCRAYVDDALAIRAAFPDAEDAEVPDGFAQGVMAAIRAQAAPQAPPAAPRKRRLSKLLLPLAACCAIVLLVRGVGFSGGKLEAPADTAASITAESYAEEPAAQEEDGYALAAAEARATPPEAAKNTVEDTVEETAEDAVSTYFTILSLPPEAADLLTEYTPFEEDDIAVRYALPGEAYEDLLTRLDSIGCGYTERLHPEVDSDVFLVVLARS